MEDAVVHRMSPGTELTADARQFRGMSMLRMAEEMLGSSGISVRGMTAHEIAERALHTTSDFPALMGNAMNRRLRAAYEENQPSYRRWARRAPNAPDFRSIDVIQVSAMPDLLKVNEAGEFKYGTASDGKVSYSVLTYGRIIGISRQTIINDDLRALERMTTGFAASAARLENRTAYAILTANGAMGYDNVALFHADHGNLAGAGAAISATTLGAGRTAMRLQKGLQEEELKGGDAPAGSSSTGALIAALALDRFAQATGQIKREGVKLGSIVSADINFTNNLDKIETIQPDGEIEGADGGTAMASGSLTARYADNTLATDASSGVPVDLSWTWAFGADYSLTLDCPRVFLPRVKRPISGPGGVQATYNWQASGEDGACLTATLVNDQESY